MQVENRTPFMDIALTRQNNYNVSIGALRQMDPEACNPFASYCLSSFFLLLVLEHTVVAVQIIPLYL